VAKRLRITNCLIDFYVVCTHDHAAGLVQVAGKRVLIFGCLGN